MSLIEENSKEAIKKDFNDLIDKTFDTLNSTADKIKKSLMRWDEFEKKLSDKIDHEIVKRSSSGMHMIRGECQMKNENESIMVRCELYYDDDLGDYHKQELNYRVPLYKFNHSDESTKNKLNELKIEKYILYIEAPEI